MTLENITGNLLYYKKLVPGTFQHVDQLTAERRTNTDLRRQCFYTADGNLYTVQRGKILWAITREPQNLVLQHIDEAYKQLVNQENYFPDTNEAKSSLEHSSTIVVELEGLELVKENNEYSNFVFNPKKLNSQQRKAAQRIYGPDEDNFEQNMEMFAKIGITPCIYVLTSDYVQETLKRNGKKFLGRASWLVNFDNGSVFGANVRLVYDHLALRGVHASKASTKAPEGRDAPKNDEISSNPQQEIGNPPLYKILACLGDDVAPSVRPNIEGRIRKLYKP